MFVRMPEFFRSALFKLAEQCQTMEQVEIDNFPRYKSELDAEQFAKIETAVNAIMTSATTPMQVAAVQIVGHADIDVSIPAGPARTEQERNVSIQRALAAESALLDRLRARGAAGARIAAILKPRPTGKGATQLKVSNPANESDRRKNRRVVIQMMRCALPDTPSPIPPDLPHEPPGDANNPNAVFAGNRFRVKILNASASGLGVSFGRMTLAFWDLDNNRLAKYLVKTGAGGGGLAAPFSTTGETEWSSKIIKTQKPRTVEQLDGSITFAEVVIPTIKPPTFPGQPGPSHTGNVSGMVLSFMFMGEFPPTDVTLNTGGSSTSMGSFEAGKGESHLISGSTVVYNGGAVPQ